jgi:hypothetical protein
VLFNKDVDIPVSAGKGKEWWNVRGYAILTWFGNKDTRNRPHKQGRRKGKGQGNVEGTTGYNPFELAKKTKGSKALAKFAESIRLEVRRQYKKG